MDAGPIDLVRRLRLGKRSQPIAELLAERFGQHRTTDQIAAVIYAGDPGGGPDNAARSIAVMIHNMRPLMRAIGLDILSKTGPGGGYWMAWRDE